MIDAPVALAFSAGLVATLNPCGFAMMPAYLSWYLGTDPQASRPNGVTATDRLGRALLVGGTVSAGFLVVFGITGTLATAGVRSFVDYVPWVALVVGIAVGLVGLALLWGREIAVMLPKHQTGRGGREVRSMFAFGVSYAVASLSCTLPVFLSVVAGTFTRSDLASGVVVFVAYGIGMSLVLFTVTVALALAQHSVVQHLRTLSRHLGRIAGALLVLAGTYIVYYWAFNLSTDPGETTGAQPARLVERLSAEANGWIEALGWRAVLLLTVSVVAASVATVSAQRRQT